MPMSLYRPYSPHEVEAMAERGSELSGEIEFTRLKRLTQLAGPGAGCVNACLRFRKSGGDWALCPIIDLEYDTSVELVCQRCLAPVDCRVEGSAHLAVLDSASLAQHLPEQLEPLVLEGESLKPLTLIEDEILLSLPLVPRHGSGQCKAPTVPSDNRN